MTGPGSAAPAASSAVGAAARARRTAEADRLVGAHWPATDAGGLSVVALGGYGRSELGPHSDLDLLLLHADDTDPATVEEVANGLLYPLWDSRFRVDHAVRRIGDALAAAREDVRSAMSLLDARHVAGDPELTLRLRSEARAYWRRRAPWLLPQVRGLAAARAERLGELAQIAEPDLKESAGGLRDVVVLQALAATWLVDVPHQSVTGSRDVLLDLRDATHEVSGRSSNRLVAEIAGEVGRLVGAGDRVAVLRSAYRAGRTVSLAQATTWRRLDAALATIGPGRARRPPRPRHRPGPAMRPVCPGAAETDGEVVLDGSVSPADHPLLGLDVAAAAARAGLPLSPALTVRLARELPPVPTPWPPQARRLLVRLLGAGPALVPVWDALDEVGVVARWLPEWERISMLPPENAVHRHTVDRHSLLTVAGVAAHDDVTRPDLLAVAALLHDIGKGEPGDHCAVGAALAAQRCARWGYPTRDVATVARAVELHLLIPELATSRDLDDPATALTVAEQAGSREVLEILAALAQADARATGPAAATRWRLQLMRRLVHLARPLVDQGR